MGWFGSGSSKSGSINEAEVRKALGRATSRGQADKIARAAGYSDADEAQRDLSAPAGWRRGSR